MTNEEIKKLIKESSILDEAAEKAGGYVEWTPSSLDEVHYNYRRLDAYCKEKHIAPKDLTPEEIKQFEV